MYVFCYSLVCRLKTLAYFIFLKSSRVILFLRRKYIKLHYNHKSFPVLIFGKEVLLFFNKKYLSDRLSDTFFIKKDVF